MIKGRYKVIWEEGTGRIHLFDLEQDPRGKRDLAVTMRPQSEKLVKELKSWVRNSRMKHKRLMAASRASKGSKAHRPKVSKRILQRLKSLGYLQ
ncbi:MAG: hypothetical protein JRG73_09600 [Deltaproteobacteria bacterium]|nr:hypothetical protein [Deltaproteobacteria bacterium]